MSVTLLDTQSVAVQPLVLGPLSPTKTVPNLRSDPAKSGKDLAGRDVYRAETQIPTTNRAPGSLSSSSHQASALIISPPLAAASPPFPPHAITKRHLTSERHCTFLISTPPLRLERPPSSLPKIFVSFDQLLLIKIVDSITLANVFEQNINKILSKDYKEEVQFGNEELDPSYLYAYYLKFPISGAFHHALSKIIDRIENNAIPSSERALIEFKKTFLEYLLPFLKSEEIDLTDIKLHSGRTHNAIQTLKPLLPKSFVNILNYLDEPNVALVLNQFFLQVFLDKMEAPPLDTVGKELPISKPLKLFLSTCGETALDYWNQVKFLIISKETNKKYIDEGYDETEALLLTQNKVTCDFKIYQMLIPNATAVIKKSIDNLKGRKDPVTMEHFVLEFKKNWNIDMCSTSVIRPLIDILSFIYLDILEVQEIHAYILDAIRGR